MDFVARYRAVADLPAPDVGPIASLTSFAGIDRLMAPC